MSGTLEFRTQFRWVIFGLLLINALWEDVVSVSHLDPSLRGPMGMMDLLGMIPGWWEYAYGPEFLRALKLLTIFSLLAAMIGFIPRWSIPTATVLTLIHGGILRQYSHLFHTMLIPLQFSLLLSIDALSGQRWISNQLLKRLCISWVAFSYLLAGMSKIANGGWTWWDGDNLRAMVMQNSINQMQFDFGLTKFFIDLDSSFYGVAGLASLLLELSYPLIFISTSARRIVPIGIIAMHLGIWLSHGIFFPDLLVLNGFVWYHLNAASQLVAAFSLRTIAIPGALLIAVWLMRIEWYPMTSWQIYSGQFNRERAVYWKMTVTDHTGIVREFSPADFIPALKDCRYRDHFYVGKDATISLLRSVKNAASSNSIPLAGFQVEAFWFELNQNEFGRLTPIWKAEVSYQE